MITIPGYIITFGGIYTLVGSHIARHIFGNPRCWGLTQIITIAYGVLVVAPVVLGLRFGGPGDHAFEVILLLAMSVTILARGGHAGLSGAPFNGRAAPPTSCGRPRKPALRRPALRRPALSQAGSSPQAGPVGGPSRRPAPQAGPPQAGRAGRLRPGRPARTVIPAPRLTRLRPPTRYFTRARRPGRCDR